MLCSLQTVSTVIVNDVRSKFAYLRMTWLTLPLLWFEIVVLALFAGVSTGSQSDPVLELVP
jgi:hypothetical protein